MTGASRERYGTAALEALGPGLVTGAADDDPSGIATYSQVGAQFGYGLLWTMLVSYPLMSSVQVVSARIGQVTRHGIGGNMRGRVPRAVALPVIGAVVVANTINIGAALFRDIDGLSEHPCTSRRATNRGEERSISSQIGFPRPRGPWSSQSYPAPASPKGRHRRSRSFGWESMSVSPLESVGREERFERRGRIRSVSSPVVRGAGLVLASRWNRLPSLRPRLPLKRPLDAQARLTLFRAADAVLANSGREPFGLVGLETMAVGGIACTGCTGEDYAIPGRNALVMQTTDPREFVQLYESQRENPGLEYALRRSAKVTARAFAWPEVIERHLLPRLELTS